MMDALAAATFLLAVFTAALAFVTVFQKEMRSMCVRPRLRLSGQRSPRYVIRSPSSSWYWIRMELTNGTGIYSETARDVEIFIERVERLTAAGKFEPLQNVGLNLCWSWGTDTLFTDILPGTSKFFNIGHVTHPSGRKDFPDYVSTEGAQARAFMTLASYPRAPGYEAIFEPGVYRICLLIGGKNVRTERRWVKFGFEGEWTSNDKLMLPKLTLEIEH